MGKHKPMPAPFKKGGKEVPAKGGKKSKGY